jgi:hypothetical protein
LGVALFQGQPSLILLATYALAFVELRKGRDYSAGFWLGLGLFRFQFVIPFVFLFLLRRKWRFLAGFFTSSAGVVLLSAWAVGWSGILSYGRFLLEISRHPENLSYGSATDMATIYGFLQTVFGNVFGYTATNVLVGVFSLALLLTVGLGWKRVRDSDELAFASAIASSLLAGLHMFTHDFSPLLLGLLLAAANLPRGSKVLRTTVIATLALFWFFPVYILLVAWHRLYLMCPMLLIFAIASLVASRRARQSRDIQAEVIAARA